MAEMADGTGGVFFQNNNDMNAGFRTVGGLAEFSYVLVFSPSELKPNGKYHKLKVSLAASAKDSHLSVQARRGYFAPSAALNSARKEDQEIADAVFSRDQTEQFPHADRNALFQIQPHGSPGHDRGPP